MEGFRFFLAVERNIFIVEFFGPLITRARVHIFHVRLKLSPVRDCSRAGLFLLPSSRVF